jgi:hypothetical protein
MKILTTATSTMGTSNFGSTITGFGNFLTQVGLAIGNSSFTEAIRLLNSSVTDGADSVVLFDPLAGSLFTAPEIVNDTNFGQDLRIQYTTTDRTLTFAHASLSTAGFADFATLRIDGTNPSGADYVENWGMSSSDVFDINIFAGTEFGLLNPASLSSGILTADDFSLVPEPSSYTMLVGTLALGAVLVRRRR